MTKRYVSQLAANGKSDILAIHSELRLAQESWTISYRRIGEVHFTNVNDLHYGVFLDVSPTERKLVGLIHIVDMFTEACQL
jgi:hypothetical protein